MWASIVQAIVMLASRRETFRSGSPTENCAASPQSERRPAPLPSRTPAVSRNGFVDLDNTWLEAVDQMGAPVRCARRSQGIHRHTGSTYFDMFIVVAQHSSTLWPHLRNTCDISRLPPCWQALW